MKSQHEIGQQSNRNMFDYRTVVFWISPYKTHVQTICVRRGTRTLGTRQLLLQLLSRVTMLRA